jgi:anti-anti-sigma regulatory factor
MSSTEFFGSSFIEVLFRVWKRLTSNPGAHLGICAMQPYCREVLHVTHLDTLWQIYDTYQAASDEFNKTIYAG